MMEDARDTQVETAPMQKRQPYVREQSDRVGRLTTKIADQIGFLEERLHGVLRSDMPMPSSPDRVVAAEAPPEVPLAADLRTTADQLEAILMRVEGIAARIEV